MIKKQKDEAEKLQRLEAEREAQRKRKDKEKQQLLFRHKNYKDQKLQVVEEVRRQKEQMRHNLYGMRESAYNDAQYRKQMIREQKQQGVAR